MSHVVVVVWYIPPLVGELLCTQHCIKLSVQENF